MYDNIRSICVFCGSSSGSGPVYLEAAKSLANCLYERDVRLVYGGAKVGTMGAVADQMMALGGEVIGVIPKSLVQFEVAHYALSELIIVENMHERKAKMAELSDGFIALPGGLGTLEELFEALTWSQLGFHKKPCGLLNIGGFYDELLSFLGTAVQEGFMRPEHRDLLIDEPNAPSIVDRMIRHQPVFTPPKLKISAVAEPA